MPPGQGRRCCCQQRRRRWGLVIAGAAVLASRRCAGSQPGPALAATPRRRRHPQELCGIWAYIKWEQAGCPNRSQSEADHEYEAAIQELVGLLRRCGPPGATHRPRAAAPVLLALRCCPRAAAPRCCPAVAWL